MTNTDLLPQVRDELLKLRISIDGTLEIARTEIPATTFSRLIEERSTRALVKLDELSALLSEGTAAPLDTQTEETGTRSEGGDTHNG